MRVLSVLVSVSKVAATVLFERANLSIIALMKRLTALSPSRCLSALQRPRSARRAGRISARRTSSCAISGSAAVKHSPSCDIHYFTLGTARKNAAGDTVNAVLLLHGTSGSSASWLQPTLANELFGKGQPLDASQYFVMIPDGIGAGGSSKPSDGLRGRFPHYRYRDMVEAQYRVVTEALGIRHLRLVLGTSMGGMQTWMWGEMYPDFMDALVPIASQPIAMSGRNWITRRIRIEAIRNDPDWNGGNYEKNPTR